MWWKFQHISITYTYTSKYWKTWSFLIWAKIGWNWNPPLLDCSTMFSNLSAILPVLFLPASLLFPYIKSFTSMHFKVVCIKYSFHKCIPFFPFPIIINYRNTICIVCPVYESSYSKHVFIYIRFNDANIYCKINYTAFKFA